MSTTSYVDLGAVQRPESGTETPQQNYLDLGAAQRPEVTLLPAYLDPLIFGAAM